MKIEMTNYGTKFDLHCPRCGNTEWSEEEYNSGVNLYHKCMHCGADVCTDTHTKIGIVIEQPYYEFTPNTYDVIKGFDGVRNSQWKLPGEKSFAEDDLL
jgi:hypothetical protein